jgi:putative ABC transport system ATP-binding protein
VSGEDSGLRGHRTLRTAHISTIYDPLSTIHFPMLSLTGIHKSYGRALWRRRHVGFVFQAFHLLPHLTVAANVGLPLALNGVGGREADLRIEEMLAAVGLADRRSAYPRELSGGESQRVAVARALVHRPALVLADEPTGNLDPENAAEVLALLRQRIKQDRAAGILVTHSALAAASTDRVYVLARDGLAERTPGLPA